MYLSAGLQRTEPKVNAKPITPNNKSNNMLQLSIVNGSQLNKAKNNLTKPNGDIHDYDVFTDITDADDKDIIR